jgi:hypothetical protein
VGILTRVAPAGERADLPESPHCAVEFGDDTRVTWPDGVITHHRLNLKEKG